MKELKWKNATTIVLRERAKPRSRAPTKTPKTCTDFLWDRGDDFKLDCPCIARLKDGKPKTWGDAAAESRRGQKVWVKNQ